MKGFPQYTDDPVADWDAYCLAEEEELKRLPICDECGERIEDEFCYDINGEVFCETCMEQYKRFTTDLME